MDIFCPGFCATNRNNYNTKRCCRCFPAPTPPGPDCTRRSPIGGFLGDCPTLCQPWRLSSSAPYTKDCKSCVEINQLRAQTSRRWRAGVRGLISTQAARVPIASASRRLEGAWKSARSYARATSSPLPTPSSVASAPRPRSAESTAAPAPRAQERGPFQDRLLCPIASPPRCPVCVHNTYVSYHERVASIVEVRASGLMLG